MSTLAAKLDIAVRAVCPILGVSIGDPASKATWLIRFAPEATQQQRDAAVAVVGSFVYAPDDPADMDLLEKALKALALVMRDYCNQLSAGTYSQKTVPQLRADFKAKFDLLP